jgi:hypothetical protein
MDIIPDDRPGSLPAVAHSSTDFKTVRLEFSNYAQISVTRNGGKAYEFEYWGVHYAWKRVVRTDGVVRSVSFHLTMIGSNSVLAYIVPSPLTPAQAEEECSKGGWIPSCSMWLADESLVRGRKDISE